MRIQWSSEAAREMLAQLERTEQNMGQCLRQSARVWDALHEANPDGENRALKSAAERYESCERRLKEFATMLEEFESAVRKADELFDETERGLIRMADNLEKTEESPVYMEDGTRIWWSASAYMPMPIMRVSRLTPAWLEEAAASQRM